MTTHLLLLLLMMPALTLAGSRLAGEEVRPALHPFDDAAAPAIAPREIARGPRGHREIALTFDAGGDADGFAALLTTLDELRVQATFFLTGKWVQRYRREAQMLAVRRHAIGNHSWAHLDYTGLSDAMLELDLLAAEAMLARRFGPLRIRPLFRVPFGSRDARVLNRLGECGYWSVYWTLDTLDSIEPRKSSTFIAQRVLRQSDHELDGAIILCHVGLPETREALPLIVGNLRSRGFRFVTLRQWVD